MNSKRLSARQTKSSKLSPLLEFPEVKSWRALMMAFKAIFSQLEKGLMAEGCSVSRFQILFNLYFDGEMPAVEIARKLVVTRGNISTFLRRMESDGLIRKRIPKGQKRPLYSLTERGNGFFEAILPAHIGRVRRLAPKLSAETISLLTQKSR